MKLLKYLLIMLMIFLSIAALLEKLGYSEWLDDDCNTIIDPVSGSHCDDSLRYNGPSTYLGGNQIDVQNFKNWKALYDNQTPLDTSKFKGTLISKQAIDMMFNGDSTANVLVCHMAIDSTGSKTMVYEVKRSDNYKIVPIELGPVAPPPYFFYSPYHCPDMCIDTR